MFYYNMSCLCLLWKCEQVIRSETDKWRIYLKLTCDRGKQSSNVSFKQLKPFIVLLFAVIHINRKPEKMLRQSVNHTLLLGRWTTYCFL